MDNIEIIDFSTTTNNSSTSVGGGPPQQQHNVQHGLQMLLHESKGYPVHNGQTDTLDNFLQKSQLLHSLTRSTSLFMPVTESRLAGVYWVPLQSVFQDKKKLQSWCEYLIAEPFTVPGQYSPKIKCYYLHSKKPLVGLPRFWALSVFGPPKEDHRLEGLPLSYRPSISLRPLQQQAVDQSIATLQEWGGAVITADCGFGKTRIAMGLITALGRRTMILCNRELLMQQWASVIRSLTTWTIGWILSSNSLTKKTIEVDGHTLQGASGLYDVCIVSIDTLIEGTVPKDILQTFGLVVVDEAHHLAAKTLVHALPLLPARYIVGLSATPDRRDGLEHVLYWLMGPSSFVYKRIPMITGEIHTVKVFQAIVPEDTLKREIMYSNGQLAFAEMTNSLADDTSRNAYIIDLLLQCLQHGRKKIIVVSSLVDHCCHLYDLMYLLYDLVLSERPTAALMCGPYVESDLAKDSGTQVVFATYGLLEEGYDDPVLDTLVLATPRSRIQQTIGRIERQHEGKLQPLVIDICDDFGPYTNMWYKRSHFYKSRGFSIEKTLF